MTNIDRDLLAGVSGGFIPINTILDHKPGTDWGKVGQAALNNATSPAFSAASTASSLLPGAAGKIAPVAVAGVGAYYGAANEYLAQQKKLK